MLGAILRRLSEPSSYAGLAAIVAGLGQIGDMNEAPAVADAVVNAGAAAAASGPYAGLLALGLGVLSVFMPEGRK